VDPKTARSAGSGSCGLLRSRPRRRPRESSKRFELPGSMQLRGIDIVSGIQIVNRVTGEAA